MNTTRKIGLGGGCHWCTEAVFQSLKGVKKVEQGFIASKGSDSSFSEAVIVHYDANLIAMKDLIGIHIHTHKSTSAHSMRDKYRSAIYAFNRRDETAAVNIIDELQGQFEELLITRVLSFAHFKPSDPMFLDYYYSDIEKPFCKTYISPKLKILLKKYEEHLSVNVKG